MDIIEKLKHYSKANNKLAEYISLVCDYEHEFYGKDFENNHKFIFKAFIDMRKNNEDEIKISNFLQDAIDIHKKNYI